MAMVSRAVLRTQPDGKLATLAAAGSEPAFEAIVHRYRRPLLGYCRRLRLSDNRSEDVVQQTFLNAWGSLRDGTEVRDLRPWLYRITHNQAVTMLRAVGGEETSLNAITDGCADAPDRTAATVEDVFERQARLREALSAVAALPPLQREALLATAVDGLSYDEVAGALNTTADAVRGLVYRARNTLRTGVAVLSPAPLVVWAANQAGPVISSASVQQWVAETVSSGGSVGLSAAAAVKGAVMLASSAAVVGSTVSISHQVSRPSAAHGGAAGATRGVGARPRSGGAVSRHSEARPAVPAVTGASTARTGSASWDAGSAAAAARLAALARATAASSPKTGRAGLTGSGTGTRAQDNPNADLSASGAGTRTSTGTRTSPGTQSPSGQPAPGTGSGAGAGFGTAPTVGWGTFGPAMRPGPGGGTAASDGAGTGAQSGDGESAGSQSDQGSGDGQAPASAASASTTGQSDPTAAESAAGTSSDAATTGFSAPTLTNPGTSGEAPASTTTPASTTPATTTTTTAGS